MNTISLKDKIWMSPFYKGNATPRNTVAYTMLIMKIDNTVWRNIRRCVIIGIAHYYKNKKALED